MEEEPGDGSSTPTAPEPGIVFITPSDFGPLKYLNPFRIRNGDPLEARSLLIKPTIPRAYHWIPIADLPPEEAVHHTDAFIKSAMHSLTTHPPAGVSDAQRRKLAIALGVSRAVSTQMYQLTEPDFIPGEMAEPVLRYHPEAEQSIGMIPGVQNTAALTTDLALTEPEKAAVAAIASCSIGIVPLQGYSLHMTGHHYLSDAATQSRRAYRVVEQQFWSSQDVREWFTSDAELLQDVLWHKSCHPVNITLKQDMAMDETVASMLKKAGAGSAAARLPAMESEMRAANSYRTLLQSVRKPLETLEGEIEFVVLEDAMDAVRLFPGPTKPQPTNYELPQSVPAWVNSRERALQHLTAVLERNTDVAAYAYGFYCAMLDATMAFGAEQRMDTLRNSFSLAKLRGQCAASYNAGSQSYGDYAAKKQASRNDGVYEIPRVVMR